MTAKLFGWVLAGALMVPQAALANDAAADAAASLGKLTASSSNALPLPPIRHLETIPWLSAGIGQGRQKVDILLGPKFEVIQQLAEKPPQFPPLNSRDAAMKTE